jgi:hypothetical protein
MRSALSPGPSAVRIRLATGAGVACGTSLLSAFPDALPECGVCVDELILLSLVILPDSEFAARAPPRTTAPKRMPPSRSPPPAS